jgi:hypothetical protein
MIIFGIPQRKVIAVPQRKVVAVPKLKAVTVPKLKVDAAPQRKVDIVLTKTVVADHQFKILRSPCHPLKAKHQPKRAMTPANPIQTIVIVAVYIATMKANSLISLLADLKVRNLWPCLIPAIPATTTALI